LIKTHPYRVIISGGGTGGHVFPAIAIANAFRDKYPDVEILFVGAEGKMEMVRVPEAGYKIVGLWISGIKRSVSVSNLAFPLKFISSYLKARRIIRKFKPHVAIGTGGYASGPLMIVATQKKIPALLQEQNSHAGLTNKKLASRVQRICVAYPGMEKYFDKNKIQLTGNPVRKDIIDLESKRDKALNHFGFNSNAKILLILGGSGGAKRINESILAGLDQLIASNVQVIWQTGKVYFLNVTIEVSKKDLRNVRVYDFIKEMDLAYAAADVVISRAGALSISELCLAKKPALLVPSPNVADDHQTKNAMSLVNENAALIVTDQCAKEELVQKAIRLLHDEKHCEILRENIARLAKPGAAEEIVIEIEKLLM